MIFTILQATTRTAGDVIEILPAKAYDYPPPRPENLPETLRVAVDKFTHNELDAYRQEFRRKRKEYESRTLKTALPCSQVVEM